MALGLLVTFSQDEGIRQLDKPDAFMSATEKVKIVDSRVWLCIFQDELFGGF